MRRLPNMLGRELSPAQHMTRLISTSFYDCCPPDLFSTDALKELPSLFSHFLPSQISVFSSHSHFPFLRGAPWVALPFVCRALHIFPKPGALHPSLFLLSRTGQFHILALLGPSPRHSAIHQTRGLVQGDGDNLGICHRSLLPSSRAAPAGQRGARGFSGQEQGRLGLSGCQHLKGNEEEEGERWRHG